MDVGAIPVVQRESRHSKDIEGYPFVHFASRKFSVWRFGKPFLSFESTWLKKTAVV